MHDGQLSGTPLAQQSDSSQALAQSSGLLNTSVASFTTTGSSGSSSYNNNSDSDENRGAFVDLLPTDPIIEIGNRVAPEVHLNEEERQILDLPVAFDELVEFCLNCYLGLWFYSLAYYMPSCYSSTMTLLEVTNPGLVT